MLRLLKNLLFVLAVFLLPPSGHAGNLPPAEGPVLLTIKGNIQSTNAVGCLELDQAQFNTLPVASFTTSTIWTEGEATFKGVPLKKLLDFAKADGNRIKASAINDYSIEIPMDSITDDYPLVAYEMNDTPMTIRTNGPLWIVYPYDQSSKLQSETIYARSIWQLNRLEIID